MKTRLFLGLSIVVCTAVVIAGHTWASGIDIPGLSVQSPSVQITVWPAPVPPGGAAPITWQISGGTVVSHSDIHWGIKSSLNCPDPLPNSTGDHTGGMGSYTDSLTMLAGHDYLCFRVHATIDGTDYYDPPLGHDPEILPAVLYGNAGNGTGWGDGVNYCSPYNGICWETDHPFSSHYWGYVGGSIHQVSDPISGTQDVALYQTQRQGMSAYKFWVSTAYVGTYDVQLRFAELDVSGPGQRVFDVQIEGQPVLTGFDLYTEAGGKDVAYDRTFRVTVADGEVTVEFLPRVGQPVLNAISVRGISASNNAPTASPTPSATSSVTTTTATPSATPTGTVTPTPSATSEDTATATTTPSPTATATASATATPSTTPSATATSSPTTTTVPGSPAASATPTASETITATAPATGTPTGTPTVTISPTVSATAAHKILLPLLILGQRRLVSGSGPHYPP
ncbi:MAG: hypothetical protein GXP41_09105 [Chloroflexi bacterium]|nr:hypothetical protein [Chloroflexota bacterium]